MALAIESVRKGVATGGPVVAVAILAKDMAIAAANTGFASSARNPMPLSAIIVDDEQLARDELAYLLRRRRHQHRRAGQNGLRSRQPKIKEPDPVWCISTCRCPGPTVSASSKNCSTAGSTAQDCLRYCLRSIRSESVRSECGGLHPQALR